MFGSGLISIHGADFARNRIYAPAELASVERGSSPENDPIRHLATIAACPHGAVIPLIIALRSQAPQWRKRLPDFFFLVMIIARWGRAPSWRKSFHSQLPEAKARKNSSACSSEFFSEKQYSPCLQNRIRWSACASHRFFIAAAATFFMVVHASAMAAEKTVVIECCNLFDSESGTMQPEQTIVICGSQIIHVGGINDVPDIPPDATRIDGRGKFALPGLIDAHVHVVHVLDFAHVTGDEVLPLYLAAGVTSIRSTGDEVVAATLVARFAAAHPEFCPRVFTCSPLLDADPPIHRDVGRAVTDPTGVPELFDDLAQWDIATVKIYAGTSRPVGRAIIEESHRRGLFVTAHLGNYSAQDAVSDGVDGLEHIWSVFNYVIPPEVASQPGHRGKLDLNNPLCESLVAELAKRRVFVDPTLAVFRNMILLPDVPEIHDHPDNAVVPRRLREFWPVYLQRTGCPQGGSLEDRRREFAKFQELTGKLYRAGVPILVGTDSPEPQVTPGFSLHQELEMLVESGLPPAAVLTAATLTNATVLGEQDHLGSISVGKTADILLLTENPLNDIRLTREIELVIHHGLICRPDELLKRVPSE